MRPRLAALGAALLMVMSFAGVASAHHVISLSGSVNCQGEYDVEVSANVFGSTSLTTTLNGTIIGHETPGGGTTEADNYGNHDFSYTGTGAAAGDTITAYVSDSQAVTTAKLVLTQDSCPTPTPTPAPTPPTFELTCENVTVSGMTEGWQFIVEPGDRLLENGPNALPAGDYTYGLRYNGDDQTSGAFTIEACATPTPEVTPTPTPENCDVDQPPEGCPTATPTATPEVTPTPCEDTEEGCPTPTPTATPTSTPFPCELVQEGIAIGTPCPTVPPTATPVPTSTPNLPPTSTVDDLTGGTGGIPPVAFIALGLFAIALGAALLGPSKRRSR